MRCLLSYSHSWCCRVMHDGPAPTCTCHPACLPYLPAGVGDYVRYSEVAFFHKRTRTLMVTDAVVYVDDTVSAL
jgi:hypothetical protein